MRCAPLRFPVPLTELIHLLASYAECEMDCVRAALQSLRGGATTLDLGVRRISSKDNRQAQCVPQLFCELCLYCCAHSLQWKGIGDDGVARLQLALSENTTLVELWLWVCAASQLRASPHV